MLACTCLSKYITRRVEKFKNFNFEQRIEFLYPSPFHHYHPHNHSHKPQPMAFGTFTTSLMATIAPPTCVRRYEHAKDHVIYYYVCEVCSRKLWSTTTEGWNGCETCGHIHHDVDINTGEVSPHSCSDWVIFGFCPVYVCWSCDRPVPIDVDENPDENVEPKCEYDLDSSWTMK